MKASHARGPGRLGRGRRDRCTVRALAAAYAVFALLALPALLWAQEPARDTPAPAATAPADRSSPGSQGLAGESAGSTSPASGSPTSQSPGSGSPASQSPSSGSPTSQSPSSGSPTSESPSSGSPTSQSPGSESPAAEGPAPAASKEAETGPVARAAASGGVTIEDFAFAPRTITVDVGDTVTWTNRDGVEHTATADDGAFDTGLLGRGQSGSHTFDQAGSFPYHCTPHPNMTGTVVVRAASGDGAAAGGGGSTGTGAGDPAASTPSSSSGSTLPATGLSVALVALGGAVLLAAGALLRRRVED